MNDTFNKNDYRTTLKKVKIIIDTDPGVDDISCVIYAMNDDNIEVKLLTTVVGNIPVEKCTRNLLHVSELFGFNVPVAQGAKTAMKRISPTAEHVHGKEGMGGYVPPSTVSLKPLDIDAVEATYRVLSEGDGDIVPVLLGPVTNLANLLTVHPDIKSKIPKIVVMGGAPYGNPNYPEHTSFNLSSDPEAFKILLDSNVPILMCPSHVGRTKAHLDERFVLDLPNYGDAGKFLYAMYSAYWEPGYFPKRITTNDSCALFSLVYPKMFEIKTVDVSVNVTDAPGRTLIDFTPNGKTEFVDDVNKPAFLSLLLNRLNRIKNIKLNL